MPGIFVPSRLWSFVELVELWDFSVGPVTIGSPLAGLKRFLVSPILEADSLIKGLVPRRRDVRVRFFARLRIAPVPS